MIKKLTYTIFIAALLFVGNNAVFAQLVNNGVKLFVDQGALLYVDAKYIHNDGVVLNNGEIVAGGDWENNHPALNVFDNLSNGIVKFTAKSAAFSGTTPTIFPKLVFKGDGVFTMNLNIGARLSIDLDDAEVKTGNHQLTFANYDPSAVYFKNGFINTGTNGSFVRYIKENETYFYPLGSSKLGLKRFVSIYSKQVTKSAIGAAFVDRDPSSDGYSRFSKTASVADINDIFYHVITQNQGANLILDVSFYTSATEKFTGLASWTNKNNWDKASPTDFRDNAAISAGITKSFFHRSFNLAGNSSVPFAFANVTNVNQLEFYNAFSPDGDGKNDTWEIKNIDTFPDNDLKVFDRSGNLVYKASGYNSSKYWDGQNVASGTYVYILRAKIDGKDQYFKGSITMVKN